MIASAFQRCIQKITGQMDVMGKLIPKWFLNFASTHRYYKIIKSIKIIASILFVTFLLVPTFEAQGRDESGFTILIFGWLWSSFGEFAWVGSLGILASIYTYRRWPMFITAFAFLSGLNWHYAADGGGVTHVTSYGPGYYAWMAAMFIASIPVILPIPAIENKSRKPFEG